jgi:hypothetical protein
MTKEEWRPVVGFEDTYMVSSRGQVKRIALGRNTYIGKILSHTPDKHGRMQVALWGTGATRRYMITVHKLVAEAFIGYCPPEKEVNHIDQNYTNNNASNLEYITHQENTEEAGEYGKFGRYSRFTRVQIEEIKEKVKHTKQKTVALEYGVRQSTISRIVNNVRATKRPKVE